MEKEQLERIRQLARKQKAEGLTSEEAEEQQRLHIKYLTSSGYGSKNNWKKQAIVISKNKYN